MIFCRNTHVGKYPLKGLLFSLLLIAGLSLYGFRMLESAGVDTLKKLGIPEDVAKDCVWSSFSGMYFFSPGGQQIKKTPVSERAAVIQQVGQFAKQYTGSKEFNSKYLEYRESNKPTPPEKPKSVDEMRKEQKAQMQKSIQEFEQTVKSMPPEQQASMKEVVASMKEQLKSYDDPNNPMFSPQVAEIYKQSYDAAMQDYKSKLVEWEQKYPPSPNAMVKRWLTEYLEVSKDIDFNAKLIDGDGGKKLFAETRYERKSSQWKMCFRAGKETVETGRTFAKQWLEELNRSQ